MGLISIGAGLLVPDSEQDEETADRGDVRATKHRHMGAGGAWGESARRGRRGSNRPLAERQRAHLREEAAAAVAEAEAKAASASGGNEMAATVKSAAAAVPVARPMSEAVAMWPDKRLWINFPSSVHLRSYDQVRAVAEEMLAAGGHTGRLQIQVSENVPHAVWRTSLPAILDAIDAFGAP